MFRTIAFGLTVVAFACTGAALAQRTTLQTAVFPAYNTIMDIVELAPGRGPGPHTHPGIEIGYVLEGELGLSIKTIESHRSEIMKRLRIHDVVSLVRFSIRVGLVPAAS